MANTNVIAALKKSLIAYLVTEIPTLLKIYDDFPNPSEVLSMPCATVFTGSPSYASISPYITSQDSAGVGAHSAPVRYVVGSYEFPLQIDLWVPYKIQRTDFYDKLFNAINKVVNPMGLFLPLTDYYGEIAEIHITGFKYIEDEASAQRKEYRVKVDLRATVNHVVQKTENLMQDLQLVDGAGNETTNPVTDGDIDDN